jgi:hypothetical protein
LAIDIGSSRHGGGFKGLDIYNRRCSDGFTAEADACLNSRAAERDFCDAH